MKKLHIMVDCDEVLNNCYEHWVEYLNKRHNLSANAQDITSRDIHNLFPTLSKEEVRSPLTEETFGLTFKVRPYSEEYLKKMIDDGHEISIVTAHNNKTVGTKFEWILKNFPFLSKDDIIITAKKQKIIGDVLIDDSVQNLEGGNYLKILFDSPINRGYDAKANGMIRVYTLKDAYETIKHIVMKER